MEQRPATADKIGAAMVDVFVAGQRVLIDRIDVALIEGGRTLDRVAARLALVMTGALLLLGGLVIADVALIEQLSASSARGPLILGCALFHAALGGALLRYGLRRKVGQ